MPLTIKGRKFYCNGERQEMLLGVLAGKMANRVGLGQDALVRDFIDDVQTWLDRQTISFSVWLETGGWGRVEEGKGMFGSPPRDPGVWDVDWIQKHWDDREKAPRRIKMGHVSALYRKNLEWFYRTSSQTGCVFHLGIIATLKHTKNIGNGHMDHIVRLTLVLGEELQAKYPKACVMFEACNEWDAHGGRQTPYGREELHLGGKTGIQMWAQRRTDQEYFKGEGHLLTVTHGGLNRFRYPCSKSKSTFDAGLTHQERGGDWEKLPSNEDELRRLCNGQPLGNSENMYCVTWPQTVQDGWYRNPGGLNTDLNRQIEFYSHWEGFWDLAYLHADWLMQVDKDWPGPLLSAYRRRVAEVFGGGGNGGNGGNGDDAFLKALDRTIEEKYSRIMGRNPDPGGWAHYKEQMRRFYEDGDFEGLSSQQFENALLFDKAKGAK